MGVIIKDAKICSHTVTTEVLSLTFSSMLWLHPSLVSHWILVLCWLLMALEDGTHIQEDKLNNWRGFAVLYMVKNWNGMLMYAEQAVGREIRNEPKKTDS